MLTVWTPVCMEVFRCVVDRFGMTRSTALYCFTKDCQTIRSSVYAKLVRWPVTLEE